MCKTLFVFHIFYTMHFLALASFRETYILSWKIIQKFSLWILILAKLFTIKHLPASVPSALWSTTIFIFQFVIGLFGPTVFQLKRALFSSCINANAEHVVNGGKGEGSLITRKSHEWPPSIVAMNGRNQTGKCFCAVDALIVCLFVWFAIPERSSSAFRKDSRNLFFLFIFFALLHSRTYFRALQCFPICNVWLESGTISLVWSCRV